MAQRRKAPAFAAALAATALAASMDEKAEARRVAAAKTGLISSMWGLTPEGDRRLKKLAVDKLLDGSDNSQREIERILHMDFAPERGPPGAVSGLINAREPQPKLEQGHQEPLYVRVYCVIMPICLISILVTILWYFNVFDQVAITFGNPQ